MMRPLFCASFVLGRGIGGPDTNCAVETGRRGDRTGARGADVVATEFMGGEGLG